MKFITIKNGEVHFPMAPRLDKWLEDNEWYLITWLGVTAVIVIVTGILI